MITGASNKFELGIGVLPGLFLYHPAITHVVRNTPLPFLKGMGEANGRVLFSALQATVQESHPVHLSKSINQPSCAISVSSGLML